MSEETPTFETPVPIPGAVSFSLRQMATQARFTRITRSIFVTVANNGYTGDLEVALFPDSFLEDIFGYTQSTNDKVMIENAGIQPKSFALLFEEDGDTTGTKFVLYNCTCTRPSRSLSTTTETTEPHDPNGKYYRFPLPQIITRWFIPLQQLPQKF